MNQPTTTFLLLEGTTTLLESTSMEECIIEAERLLIENPARQFRVAQTIINLRIEKK